MKTPAAVINALKHVSAIYPEVTHLYYNTDAQWLFCSGDFKAPDFGREVDQNILEAAQSAVESFPAAFSIEHID